ncbi:DMBT1 [Mytilus coruscus]|uniref:DMBT1 n=1 Tax=Mytilus coruscus TaxID=42192 RepID=A0A6J8CVU2_MYTCO|nr:DMBT1 [Mytilus coruscus]
MKPIYQSAYDTSDRMGMCDYVQDAGVHCIDTVAGNMSVLVGSDGRVLLYNAETYNTSTICSYNWNDQDATVVCKQNGMGDIGKATYIDRDYNFSRSMFNVNCTGYETDLSECAYDTSDRMGMCDYVQDAGVHCIDTGYETDLSECAYDTSDRMGMCDYVQDAGVHCIDTGNETDLSECTYDTSDSMGMCDYERDAGVHCIDTDQTQLVLGPDGRILFYNTQTGDISTVCSYMWNNQGADVVCRQLGMGDSGTAVYLPRDHNYTRNMYSLECMGSETSMYDCNYQVTDYYGSCEYVSDAGVECASQVAGNMSVLVGSDGRVHLYNAETYNTSTICSYNWNDQDATVVCMQNGMGDIGKATYIDRDYNFSRSMFNVNCTGYETDLSECAYDTSDRMGMCDYVQDAGVHCIDTVAGNMSVLVGSDGRVLLYNAETYNTSTICSYNWNDQDATVVCKQNGMGDIGKATYIDRDSNFSRSIFNVYCTGNETDLSECTYDTSDSMGMCDYERDAGVHCIDTDQTQLVLGPDGRILFYNTQTGDISTVCSYMWNSQGADVVCRQLGMGDSGTAVYLPRDHNYTRNMYSLECMGSETSMYDCNYQVTDYYGSCEYVSDAGVECASQVAGNMSVLVGSDGRVLLYNAETYNTSTICSYNWNDQDATVVCKQNGMGDIGKATYIDRDYNFSRIAGNMSVLVGSDGRVLLYNAETYNTSTICSYNWNDQDATVVCKQNGMGDIGKATYIDRDYNFSRSILTCTVQVMKPIYQSVHMTPVTVWECVIMSGMLEFIASIQIKPNWFWDQTDEYCFITLRQAIYQQYVRTCGIIKGADVVCRQLGMGDSGTAVYLPRDHNYTRNMYSLECMGSETSMYDCNYQVTDYYGSCEYVSDAGVECASQVAGNMSVLVGSDGRVLLYNAETYNTSTICSYNWNDQDATVVCKQNGMGDIGKATYIDRDYNFSRSMFNVNCTGYETDLSECAYDTSDRMGMCDYVQDAGVHCIDTVAGNMSVLVGSDGRVLLYNAETYNTSTICSYNWNDQDATVVCKQNGMGDIGKATYIDRDYNFSRSIFNVYCTGNETDLSECTYDTSDSMGMCDYERDAGVHCIDTDQTQLVLGPDGRILFYNTQTGDISTTTGDGRQWYSSLSSRDHNYTRNMYSLECMGSETSMYDCNYQVTDYYGSCEYVSDAGVECASQVAGNMSVLVGSDGRVLLYNAETYNTSTICSYNWNDQDATVVCKQNGMGDIGKATYIDRDYNFSRSMFNVNCTGYETDLSECAYDTSDRMGMCDYVQDAGVHCIDTVAGNMSVLVGSDGRVLLYNAETYNTSTICSYNWNDQDATVVCKQNGMGDIGKATYIDRDYNFSRSIFNVYCTGNETDLSECTYDTSDSMGMCDYERDAGVHCIDTDQTQLVLGPDGRILFYNTQTGDISTTTGDGRQWYSSLSSRDHNYTRNMYSLECMGSETSMYDCNYQVTDYYGSCEYVSDAGVECASQVAGNMSVLVGSDGRVHLYNAETYNTSTICSYNWNDQDATVVCKQNGMGDIGKATYIDRDYNFSRSMFNVNCTGYETDLSECAYDTSDRMGMCDYVQDAGVHCIDTVAGNMSVLVGSDGRVLLYNAETYNTSTICSYNWNDQDATVVCKQNGMGDIGKATYIDRDYNFSRSIFNVYCTGNETDLSECTYDTSDSMGMCDYERDAGVHCIDTDQTQLVLGPDGRILFYNTQTGDISTVCSYMWNNQGADVVCRQLGMGDSGTAVYLPRDHNYTRNMYSLECMGSETSMYDCNYQVTDYYGSCEYVSDAGVECASQETYNTSTICSYNWNDQDATVVCKQNGMGDIGKATYIDRDYNFSRSMFNVNCTGYETDLSECAYDTSDRMGMCDYVQDAGVHCIDTVAGNMSVLVGSDGRVLLYNAETYNTSTICSYNWNDQDATVVCKQNGMGDIGKATYIDRDYNFSRSIFNVYCTGNETDLSECTYDTSDSMGMCDYERDAGVHCIDTDQTQLVLGPDGRILFYNTQTGDISTVCSYMWNNQGADVVCRQLGMGDSGTAVYLPRDHNYTRNMYSLECMGSETSMYDCNYQVTDYYGSCEYVSDAGVECASQRYVFLEVAGNMSVLVGSDGRVHLYNAETYNTSTICSYNWNDQDATVVCKQNGMGDIGKATYIDQDYNFSRSMFNVNCTGDETDLSECAYDTSDRMGMCDYVQDAGVHCIETESTSSMSTAEDLGGNVGITENTLALKSTSDPIFYQSSPNDVSNVINTHETLPSADAFSLTTDEYNSHSTSKDNLVNSPIYDLFTRTLGPNTLSTEQLPSSETVTDISTSILTDHMDITNSTINKVYTGPYIVETSNTHNMDTSTNSVILTTENIDKNSLASKYTSETSTSASVNNKDSIITMSITDTETSPTDESRTSTELTNKHFTTEPRDDSGSSSTSSLSSRSTYSESSRSEYVSTGLPLTNAAQSTVSQSAITTDLTTADSPNAQITTNSDMVSSISSLSSVSSSTNTTQTAITSVLSTVTTSVTDASNTTTPVASSANDASRCDINSNCFNSGCTAMGLNLPGSRPPLTYCGYMLPNSGTQTLPSWSQPPWPQSYPYGGFMPNQPGFWPYRDNFYGPPSGVATAPPLAHTPPVAVSLTPAVAPSTTVPDSRAQSSSSSHGTHEVTFGLGESFKAEFSTLSSRMSLLENRVSSHQPSPAKSVEYDEREDDELSVSPGSHERAFLTDEDVESSSAPKISKTAPEPSSKSAQQPPTKETEDPPSLKDLRDKDTVTSHNSFPESDHMAFALQFINEGIANSASEKVANNNISRFGMSSFSDQVKYKDFDIFDSSLGRLVPSCEKSLSFLLGKKASRWSSSHSTCLVKD